MTADTYKEIVDYLRGVIEGTPWEGHVYTVGGCCRDMVMGTPINDIDLAVTYPDGGIAFARWLVEKDLTIGKPIEFAKYGTAKIRLAAFPNHEIELVQTRREKYTDRTSRDPSVVFGTIQEDCERRDLTINSLYYDITGKKMLDFTGKALPDIENKLIRTPMDPHTTFDDDPVRILRTVRFAAKYGWKIDSDTYEAMRRHVHRLSIISPERMQGEFEKILLTPKPSRALDMLRDLGALQYIIPELLPSVGMSQSKFHDTDVWGHTLRVVDNVPEDALLRTAALFHDLGKVATRKEEKGHVRFPGHNLASRRLALQAMNRLHYRNAFIDRVLFLVNNHEAAKTWGPKCERMTDGELRALLYLCHTPLRFKNLLSLIDADNKAYAKGHNMPEQAKIILNRFRKLRREGSSMMGYAPPLKPSRIAKILKTRDEKILDKCRQMLISYAFQHPKANKEEMEKFILEKFDQKSKTSPEAKQDAAPKKKKKKHFPFRRKRKNKKERSGE